MIQPLFKAPTKFFFHWLDVTEIEHEVTLIILFFQLDLYCKKTYALPGESENREIRRDQTPSLLAKVPCP